MSTRAPREARADLRSKRWLTRRHPHRQHTRKRPSLSLRESGALPQLLTGNGTVAGCGTRRAFRARCRCNASRPKPKAACHRNLGTHPQLTSLRANPCSPYPGWKIDSGRLNHLSSELNYTNIPEESFLPGRSRSATQSAGGATIRPSRNIRSVASRAFEMTLRACSSRSSSPVSSPATPSD